MRHRTRRMSLRTPGKMVAAVGAMLGVIAVCGGVAVASGVTLPFTGDGNTISGCFSPADGSLRVLVPKSPTCAKNQTAISWNQTGPAGTDGQDGADGQPGLSGLVRVASSETTMRAEDRTGGATVFCPIGTKVLGGGYDMNSSGSESRFGVDQDGPGTSNNKGPEGGTVDYWQVDLLNFNIVAGDENPSVTFFVYANCAHVAP